MNDTVMGDTVSQMPASVAGASLRAARERAGWSVEDVATKLKLSARQIVAIEAEDWPSLPERTFTRGFFYSYARLVNVDKSVIDSSFTSRAAALSELRPLPSGIGEVTPDNTTRRPVWSRWAIPGILLAVVLGGIAWVLLHGTPLPQSASKIPLSTVKSAKTATEPSSAPATGATSTATSAVATPQSASATPASAGAPAPNSLLSNSAQTATIPPVSGAEAPVAVTPTSPAPAPQSASPASPATSNIVITPGHRRIALTVNGRSWTEIRNRRETVLSETLNNTSREISAAGPLSLVIGNASNVQLTVDGKPYDFSSYVRNDVARFSIE